MEKCYLVEASWKSKRRRNAGIGNEKHGSMLDVEATEKERQHGVSPNSQRILMQIGLK